MNAPDLIGFLKHAGREIDSRFRLSTRSEDLRRYYAALRTEFHRQRTLDRSWVPSRYAHHALRQPGSACRACQEADPLHPAERVRVADAFASGVLKRCGTCGSQWVEREVG